MEEEQPLKLLSLDGGGIRGLASLYILKHLMQLVDYDNPPKPCDYFDLIGGTSTGGLIAIMLGRLQMGVDECIRKYLDVSSAAFQPKRSRANIPARAKDLFKAQGAYQEQSLEAEFKKAALEFEGNEDAKLLCTSSPCKVLVCSFEKALNTPALFRTYVCEASGNFVVVEDSTIWEAARATSAAATFFDPMRIGRQSYVDGATGLNNPVEIVVREARRIWPDALSRIQTIVSVGTGVPELKAFGNDLKELVLTLKMIATETEQTHRRFLELHEDLGLKGRYFRFNVDQGLRDVRLDDYTKVEIIEAATRRYLASPEVQSRTLSFAAVIPPKINFVPSDLRNQILSWLPCSDQQRFYNAASELRRSDETGNWFISDYIKEWKQSNGSLLWLHAGAGSGKTVLTSKVVDYIENDKDSLIAYYYFSFQHRENHNLQDFKSALLVQLVKQLSQKTHCTNSNLHFMPASFMDLRNKYHPSRSPKKNDLDTTLKKIVKESPRAYIVIDALDECDNSQVQRDILLFVQELLQSPGDNLCILVSSRPEVDIEAAIGRMPIKKRIVKLDTSKVDSDIRSHLNLLMEDLPYCKWTEHLQQRVVDYITDRSHGVFRWADLQVEALKSKRREVDIERALRGLPNGLSETYKRILERIEFENYTQEAMSVLRWLTCARTQLSLTQIAELAAFDVQSTGTEDLSPCSDSYNVTFLSENRFPEVLEIYRILSGLITLDVSMEKDPAKIFVSFAHFSVREYLESSDAPKPFKLHVEDCEWFIFKSCLAYIKAYDLQQQESPSQSTFPLLLYSCLHLWDHTEVLSCSSTNKDEERAVQSCMSILQHATKKGGYAFSLALKRAGIDLPDTSEAVGIFMRHLSDVPDKYTLHTTVSIGDLRLIRFLLNAGVEPCEKILAAAVRRGPNIEYIILQTMLNSQANPPNLRGISTSIFRKYIMADKCFKPCLTLSQDESKDLSRERRSIWEFLLTIPSTDVNCSLWFMRSPLLLAALRGDHQFFCFLNGLPNINYNHREAHNWGLATCALVGGEENIISLVLKRPGVDLTSLDRFGWSPIDWARYRGLAGLIAPFLLQPARESNYSVSSDKLISYQEVRNRFCGSDQIFFVTFSNNGVYLAVSLLAGKCLILDVVSMSTHATLEDDGGGAMTVSWSPDDTLIATSCSFSVKVFLVKNGVLIEVIKFDNSPTRCVWLPDGESFFVGTGNSQDLYLFSCTEDESGAEEGAKVDDTVCNIYWTHPCGGSRDIALSPDGRHLVGISDSSFVQQKLFVFLLSKRSPHYVVDIPETKYVAIDCQSRQILLSLKDGGHLLIDINNGAIVQSVPSTTIFSPLAAHEHVYGGQDSSLILRPQEDGYISIWDCESSQLIGHLASDAPIPTFCVARSPGIADEFASGGADGWIRIWSRDEKYSIRVDSKENNEGSDTIRTPSP
ncbi:hypothetical protein F5Y08DRAFT_351165 [Xylaria arbuscula]|nr:hypothetical protein F5Y08DRAFT_351165 [Xylaria arbuscula]